MSDNLSVYNVTVAAEETTTTTMATTTLDPNEGKALLTNGR